MAFISPASAFLYFGISLLLQAHLARKQWEIFVLGASMLQFLLLS
jgi:hypothetical protein